MRVDDVASDVGHGLEHLVDGQRAVDGDGGGGELLKLSGAAAQGDGLVADLIGLHRQLHEDRDFGAENIGGERGLDEIDGAQRITARQVLIVIAGGDENDRRVLGCDTLADERGGFKAIHAGHVDIEKNDGEFILKESAERLSTGEGADNILVQYIQGGFERENTLWFVIDQKNIDFIFLHSSVLKT